MSASRGEIWTEEKTVALVNASGSQTIQLKLQGCHRNSNVYQCLLGLVRPKTFVHYWDLNYWDFNKQNIQNIWTNLPTSWRNKFDNTTVGHLNFPAFSKLVASMFFGQVWTFPKCELRSIHFESISVWTKALNYWEWIFGSTSRATLTSSS